MPTPFISEVKYFGPATNDFIEIVLDAGADPSAIQIVVYNPNGTVRSTNTLGAVVNTVAGKDVYVISGVGVHRNGAVALVENGTVQSFISFDNAVTATEGPANGTTSTQVGSVGNDQNASVVSTDGVSYVVQSPPDAGTIPCFVEGTLIQTDRGDRPVEELVAGDMVWTQDNGLQPLQWIGSRRVTLTGPADADLRPVRIVRNTFGPGQPYLDLWVSPSHRLLVSDYRCELFCGEPEMLIPARHLQNDTTITRVNTCPAVTYFHLLFSGHQVIRANGLETESLYPGPVSLSALAAESRDEILRIFPELADGLETFGTTARPVVTGAEAHIFATL